MKHLIFVVSFAMALTLTGSSAWAVNLPIQLPWMNASSPGITYSSSTHPNGVFVVEAYFLGCHWCNVNAPNVDDLASKFASEPRVQVLDVGVDRSDSQYQTWINRHHPNHPVLKDSSRKLIRQLGTSGYPSTYVINCKGSVVTQTSGSWETDTRQEIEEAVQQALGEHCG